MNENKSNQTTSASKIFDEALAGLSSVERPLSVDSATEDSASEPQIT